jgi:glutathione synthase/RimK-type ligase-like ATP-grasp enzyme
MLVGIHKDTYGKFGDYILRFEQILALNDIPHIRLDANDPDFWEQVAKVDIFIYHWEHTDHYYNIATTILPIIEKDMGKKCYPNQATCWHYDDKIKQYFMLRLHGFPVIPSWVFWDKKKALAWLETASMPLVFKLKGGAGSSSVMLLKTKHQSKVMINRMFGKGLLVAKIPNIGSSKSVFSNPLIKLRRFASGIKRSLKGESAEHWWTVQKNYVYFQKFCPDNDWDTRVATIGNRAYAFRRFVRKNDFRASGSNSWDLDRTKVDLRFVQIAHEISQKFKFQSMAYDFIYDENKNPVLIEISYTYGEPDYPDFNDGYWDTEMVWHDGSYHTRELIMADLLERDDLKLPELPKHDYSKIKVN